MKKSNGFTLIELVVVIVILGILAVTTAPRFLNLQRDARIASLEATKGALENAFTLFSAKVDLPSAAISETSSRRLMTINGQNIRISGYDNYPYFSYFGLGEESQGFDALTALANLDVSPIDNDGNATSTLNVEFYTVQEGDFRIFPQLEDFYGDGQNKKCYLQYNIDPDMPHFTLELSEC